VLRLHRLSPERALLWQQSPAGIDAGAFHSDVLCVGSSDLFLLHQQAFVDCDGLLATLRARLGHELTLISASESELPLTDAVAGYPFNSELVPLPDGGLALIAPRESERSPRARAFLERVKAEAGSVRQLLYVDVNDSMRNGGGPACLRLRVQLSAEERASVAGRVFFDAELDRALVAWVERNYRDRLALDELHDPQLLDESRRALDELCTLLELGSLYEFQRP
jgi:succinylarginine dihydrolase